TKRCRGACPALISKSAPDFFRRSFRAAVRPPELYFRGGRRHREGLPPPDEKQPPPPLPRLDVLRALAIILVFMIHFYWSIRDSIPPAVDAFWVPFFAWGVNGVPLFFLISGFCIHLSFRRTKRQ